ncbi:MAG: precorrin-6A reductase [Lachnospirales bacterium]
MINIMLFAGTTEGRELCEKYENENILIDVYTATEYGGELLPESKNIRIHSGRLDKDEIAKEIKRLDPFCIVDATHPYAAEISKNLKELSKEKYIRLLREEAPKVKALYADNIEKAISIVNKTKANVLITTGSKDIEKYTQIKDYKNRCVIRMLPDEENIKKALELGFLRENIIAEKGPFTAKDNIEHINRYKIKYLISKESGEAGGFTEKYYACRSENAAMIVIKRPVEEGYKANEVYSIIDEVMEQKRIYIVGIGLGNPDTMTLEACKAIENSEFIIGSKRMIDAVNTKGKDICYEYNSEKIKEIIELKNYNKIAVVFSGDVCIYSGAINLSKLLKGYDVRIIQGISSVTYLASKLGISWANSKVVSLHGRYEDYINTVKENKSVFILTSGNIGEICQGFLDNNMDKLHICIGERLSYDDEKIYAGFPDEFKDKEFDNVSIMYVENLNYGKPLNMLIEDDKFIRGNVPMTKSEIRTLVLSELDLKTNSIVYDIGAGTGSISISCAKNLTSGIVYAIECNEEAVELINKNANRFNINNLEIIKGMAKDAIPLLPDCDSAFIGGSKGELEEIVRLLMEKKVKTIVMTAIAIENIVKMLDLAKLYKFEYNIKQVMVSRGKAVGDITMLMAENPIYIIKCRLGGSL